MKVSNEKSHCGDRDFVLYLLGKLLNVYRNMLAEYRKRNELKCNLAAEKSFRNVCRDQNDFNLENPFFKQRNSKTVSWLMKDEKVVFRDAFLWRTFS